MRNFGLTLKILLIFLACGLLKCSRKNEETSQINIQIPSSKLSERKVSSLLDPAVDKLAHVIINATGSGISSPIVYQWNSCEYCADGSSTVPSSFALEIPMGSGKLIQVLAVYKNEASGAYSFYYGDLANLDLAAPEVTLSIPISSLPATDGKETITGHIAGRYFRSDGSMPTGEVYIKFNPGDGRNKMVVEKSQIVAGWFQFFGLDNVNFEYVLAETGEIIFGEAINLNHSILSSSDKVLRAGIPKHIRHNSGQTPISEEAQYFIWGWFGNSTSTTGKKTCGPTSPTTYTNLFTQDGGSNLVPQFGVIDKTNLLETAPPYANVNYEPTTGTGTGCASQITATDINVPQGLIDGQGSDNAAGFRVPFVFYSGSSIVQIGSYSPDPTKKTVTGKLLPGAETVISNIKAFKKIGVPTSYYMEKISCSAISSGFDGWIAATFSGGDVSTVAGSEGNFVINTNLTTSEISTAKSVLGYGVAMILCAVSPTGKLYETGTFLGTYYF